MIASADSRLRALRPTPKTFTRAGGVIFGWFIMANAIKEPIMGKSGSRSNPALRLGDLHAPRGRRTESFAVCDSWGIWEFLYMGFIYPRLQLVPQRGWKADLRLKAWLIPAQGNALGDRAVWFLQANGLHHRLGLAWLARHGPQDESRFQRSGWFSAANPRALPWARLRFATARQAGMNDAVGVSEAGSMLPKKSVLRPST